MTHPSEAGKGGRRPRGSSAREDGRCCSRCTPRFAASSSIPWRTPRSRRPSTIWTALPGRCCRSRVELEIRLAGDFIFVNATRLRVELDNYASFSHILADAPGLRDRRPARRAGMDRREWQIFLSLLLSITSGASRRSASRSCIERLEAAKVDAPGGGARPARGRDPEENRQQAQSRSMPRAWRSLGTWWPASAWAGAAPQAGEARGAAGGRPGAQQRNVHGRPDHHPRLRRVHVHPLGQCLHLLRRPGQEAGILQGAALRSRA